MAYLNLEEQEHLENLKHLWRRSKKYIIIAILALGAYYVVNTVYAWHQESQDRKAAIIYAEFIQAYNASDNTKSIKIAQQLIKQLPTTQYAAMASVHAASIAVAKKDYINSEKLLYWAKYNAKDKAMRSIATLRLASIYIDQNKYELAHQELMTRHPKAFDGLFYEGRGDLYLAKGDMFKASSAYKEGLQKAANDPALEQVLQLKLAIIGNNTKE